jgi:hypothetical protein
MAHELRILKEALKNQAELKKVVTFVDRLLTPHGFLKGEIYHDGHSDVAEWFLNTKREHLDLDDLGVPTSQILKKIRSKFKDLFIHASNDASGDLLTWRMSFDKYSINPSLRRPTKPEPKKPADPMQFVYDAVEAIKPLIAKKVKNIHPNEPWGFLEKDLGHWDGDELLVLPNDKYIPIEDVAKLVKSKKGNSLVDAIIKNATKEMEW